MSPVAASGLSVRRAVLVALITGISLGALNSSSSAYGSAWGPRSLNPGVDGGIFALELIAATLGTMWAWAVVAFLAGWCVRRPFLAAAIGVLTLLIAVVTYYTSDLLLDVNGQFDTASAMLWAIISLGAGSTFGLLGALGSRGDRWSILPALAAPGIVVVEQLVGHPTGSDQIRPWPTVIAWVIAACLLVLVVVAAFRPRSSGIRGSLARARR